jgi:hypothetical protein
MIQLNPTIRVHTPRGRGAAHVLIDYGPEYDLVWVVLVQTENRDGAGSRPEFWCFLNRDVRGEFNETYNTSAPGRLANGDLVAGVYSGNR